MMLITAMIGTLGFCLLFKIKRDKIIYGVIGGTISTVIYLICIQAGMDLFIQNFIPTVVATIYTEIIARVVKAPTTVFLFPAIIPLTPGGSLYYTMRAIVDGNMAEAKTVGKQTMVISLGIALGVLLVSLVFSRFSYKKEQPNTRFTKK